MARISTLREKLNWSQQRMGQYLGLAQSAVHRLEHGQRESGPVARLLDQLEGQFLPTESGSVSLAPVGEIAGPAIADVATAMAGEGA